jgi:hypothetical protein
LKLESNEIIQVQWKAFLTTARVKLSSNQELFRELIAPMATLPPSSHEEVSGLLSLLRTNPVIYADLWHSSRRKV